MSMTVGELKKHLAETVNDESILCFNGYPVVSVLLTMALEDDEGVDISFVVKQEQGSVQ